MITAELLAAMRVEQAQRVPGKAARAFWEMVMAELDVLTIGKVAGVDRNDLKQRSVEAAWRKIHGFNYLGPKALTGWLHEIVRFEMSKMVRKTDSRRKLARAIDREPVAPIGRSATSTVFIDEKRKAIREAMEQLTPTQREALEYDDTRALAKAKGISVKTAWQQRRRAEKALRRLLRRRTTWRMRIPTSR